MSVHVYNPPIHFVRMGGGGAYINHVLSGGNPAYYKTITPCILYCSRCLAEFAFSLDVSHSLKSALNSVLCALCNGRPLFYSLILTSCQDTLTSGLCGNIQNFLQTLAQVSQSHSSSSMLLNSDLSKMMMSQLYDEFDWLMRLVVHAEEEEERDNDEKKKMARDGMEKISMYLAFWTDFVRNWHIGKDWVGSEDNRTFWPLMMEFLCVCSNSYVSAIELSFLQEVACQFLAACVHNHSPNKMAFVQLFCNCVRGVFQFDSVPMQIVSPSDPKTGNDNRNVPKPSFVLTTFLHRLLTELILCPESIPVMLYIKAQEKGDTSSDYVPSLLLGLTYDTPDFHPSFPIGSDCYYVQVPPFVTVKDLEQLIESPQAKVMSKPPSAKSSSSGKGPTPSLFTKKPPPPPPSASTSKGGPIEIGTFKLKEYTLTSVSGITDGGNAVSGVSNRDVEISPSCNPEVKFEDHVKIGQLCELLRIKDTDSYVLPRLIVQTLKYIPEREFVPSSDFDSLPPTVDLLEPFLSQGGLQDLAECLPSLYPYHWSQQYLLDDSSISDVASVRNRPSRRSHSFLLPPTTLPFDSIIMLGMCLRIGCYGEMLGENPPVVFVLLKLILKAKFKGEGTFLHKIMYSVYVCVCVCVCDWIFRYTPSDPLPKSLIDQLAFLPYLIFLETLKQFPNSTEKGRGLRQQALEVGVVDHILQCLSLMGHHSPRRESREDTGTDTHR